MGWTRLELFPSRLREGLGVGMSLPIRPPMKMSAWLWTVQNSWLPNSEAPNATIPPVPRKSKLGQMNRRVART